MISWYSCDTKNGKKQNTQFWLEINPWISFFLAKGKIQPNCTYRFVFFFNSILWFCTVLYCNHTVYMVGKTPHWHKQTDPIIVRKPFCDALYHLKRWGEQVCQWLTYLQMLDEYPQHCPAGSWWFQLRTRRQSPGKKVARQNWHLSAHS